MRPYKAIVLLLFLPLAACGSAGSEPAAVPSPAPSPSPSATAARTPSPSPSPSPTPVPKPVPTPTPVPAPSATPIPIFHAPPYTVAIDAGHGGHQYGAAANGLIEKDVNLDIAMRLDALLRDAGYRMLLIRDGDYAMTPWQPDFRQDQRDDIQARVDTANSAQADILISIHHNGADDAAQSGAEVYYDPDRPYSNYSYVLADVVRQGLIITLRGIGYEPKDRGDKDDALVNGDPNNPHSWLLGTNGNFRPSLMPGIIGEALFITSEADAAQLKKDQARDAIARGYKLGIDAYFGWLQQQPPPQ